MFSQIRHPTYLSPGDLDAYLERGWFRMNQKIFITHFLHFNWNFFPSVWLRYNLQEGIKTHIDKRLKPVLKRFTLQVHSWVYSQDQEDLFSLYRTHSGLDMATTLQELLLGQFHSNIFNTNQVSIYDGSKLIALGFFDMGNISAAGISSIYHPDYGRFSLGKALIYAKMDYCARNGVKWFYPGYVVPGYKKFNYKLEMAPGHTAFYCPQSSVWQPLPPSASVPNFLFEMESKLMLLQEIMAAKGVSTTVIHYRQFDAALMDLSLPDLLHFPVFLHVKFDSINQLWNLIVFDFLTNVYTLLQCQILTAMGTYRVEGKIVCTDLLQVAKQAAAGRREEDLFPQGYP